MCVYDCGTTQKSFNVFSQRGRWLAVGRESGPAAAQDWAPAPGMEEEEVGRKTPFWLKRAEGAVRVFQKAKTFTRQPVTL